MNKLDRYILKAFLSTYVFAVIALCVIFIVVNLLENLEKFLDQKATAIAIVTYYLYLLPEIIKLLSPVALLMASLFSIGRLTNQNETTAMKSGGLSLYRMMFPLTVLSIALSFGQLYFNGWIVPRMLTKKFEMERKYFNRSSGGTETQVYNLYFRDSALRNVIFGFYDATTRTGNDATVEEYSAELVPRVVKRLDARSMTWDSVSGSWLLHSCYERVISGDTISVRNVETMPVKLNVTHSNITALQRSVDEMNFAERKDYVDLLERGGKDVRMKRIEYFGEFAFPFANFIVVLFGVPFASVRKKGGLAVEIATAMVVSFFYLVFSKVSQSLGFELSIEPVVIGWSANVLFFIIGVANVIRVRT
ncbi:MAG: LptF/LptG family permease [Candidatus Kapabacteria bacterium]|nr:LptF/LptG family permease [Candidatus Kapabacteria bacterium]